MTDAFAPASPRRKRIWLRVLIAIVIVVAVLVVAFFVADAALRSYAQKRAASEIEAKLPSNVHGKVNVTIGGGSVILQYLSGSFRDVRMSAPSLTINGAPVSVDAHLTGVPTDLVKPVGTVTATIGVPQDSANKLVNFTKAETGLRFTEGHVGYTTKLNVLGFGLEFSVATQPHLRDDGRVELTPTSVELSHGSQSLQLVGIAQGLLQNSPATICVAQYLPKAISLTRVDEHSGSVDLHLSAHDVVLDEATFATKGACSG